MSSIKNVFDPRLNGLNLVRLVLATGVMLRHSCTMLGVVVPWPPAEVLLRSVFVDGFFAISGFLILRSWLNRPDPVQFLRARCLRILPAFWVCLLVIAFVAAPLHALLVGHPMDARFFTDAFGYVWRNFFLVIRQDGIDGTPTGAAPAETGVWDGSLWTLSWEFICYLGLLAMGVTGLLRRRLAVPVLFAGSLVTLVLTQYDFLDIYVVHHASRLGTMFLAGMLIFQYQDRIPATWRLLPPALAIVLAASYLPDYRIVGALPLAYLCIVTGALIKVPALRLRNDISYGQYIYGYPVQQLLIGAGLRDIGVVPHFLLSVVCVVPLAAASWFLVERPAQRFKRPPRARQEEPATATAG